MVILNEKAEAERIIGKCEIVDSVSTSLTLLSKYYFSLGLNCGEIRNKLEEYLVKIIPEYNPVLWKDTLDNKVKNAGKYPLTSIDGVSVTQNEINKIRALKSIGLERLAFTLLCLAKYQNKKKPENNNWVNLQHKEIFKLANVPTTNYNQAIMLNQLYDYGMIRFGKKITNTNIQVVFGDDTSETSIVIADFRELGREYMNYIDAKKYIRCAECGRLVFAKNNRKKYCDECSLKIQSVQKSLYDKHRRRNSEN